MDSTLSQEEMHPQRVSRRVGKQRRKSKSYRATSTAATATILSSLSLLLLWGQYPRPAHGWGGGGSVDTTVYGDSLSRDWLSDGSTISLKLEGCMWGVTENNEDMGCMEESSNDGTEYWYQMANCRRAQVVYNLYTGSGCGNFKESFVTQNGLAEFVYYLQKYNNGYNLEGNDDGNNNDDGNGNQGYNDFDDLPLCEQANNGNYVGLGCNDDGTFAMMYFTDKYCLTPTGDVYDKLRTLNRQLRTYKSCATIYKSGGYDNNGYTLPAVLIRNSDSCSSLETSLCTDSSSMKSRRSHTSRSASKSSALNMQSLSQKSWVTKLKYVTAGVLLLASFVMFTGILFTNRRRRRALMQRKYRQSKSRKGKSKSGRSSRSKSKPRDGRPSTKSPSRRSSRAPRSRDDDEAEEEGNGGVFS